MNGHNDIHLQEWEALGPDASGDSRCHVLKGRLLRDDEARRLAIHLAELGIIEVLELSRGIEIRATSFVGRFSLGDLVITVEPKLPKAPLIHLLRYAYGLRNLDLYSSVDYQPSKWAFQDLLIQQLVTEVRELIARGLHRDYEKTWADLQSPRGRVDFQKYIQGADSASSALPCIHYPRVEDTVLNQTLHAGLRFASALTEDIQLRGSLRRLSSMLGVSVSSLPLTAGLVADSRSHLDRRTTAYEPAITIIELLSSDAGMALDKLVEPIRLNGFLFDMNRFFQALISRFLVDNLDDLEVEEESRLKNLFVYDPSHNPLRRCAPTPRPDFVIRCGVDVIAVLDAKYRNLWVQSLPRDMLYQLALYALGHKGSHRRSTIVYPVTDHLARDQVIVIRDPLSALRQAEVILRPLNIVDLHELIRGGHAMRGRRIELARRLVLGDGSKTMIARRM